MVIPGSTDRNPQLLLRLPQRAHSSGRVATQDPACSTLPALLRGMRSRAWTATRRSVSALGKPQGNSGSETYPEARAERRQVLTRREADLERRVALSHNLDGDRASRRVGRLRAPDRKRSRELDLGQSRATRFQLERIEGYVSGDLCCFGRIRDGFASENEYRQKQNGVRRVKR